ncbi:MAG: hypothetical protein QOE92_1414 [Chloroflexota bacterium]|jgi:outer membrane protein assembly factor BamB|nr:hypothetical protein [Chloroflexota bacterium]
MRDLAGARRRLVVLAMVVASVASCDLGQPAPAQAPTPTGTTSNASPSPGKPTVATWLTYHHDGSRNGYDDSSGTYTNVHRIWTSEKLDGKVYAQPLITPEGVLIATEANTLYLLNRDSGAVTWKRNMGPPIPNKVFPCGNVDPLGITGTPVVDPKTGLVYAVASLPSPKPHYILFALNTSTGEVAWQRELAPAGFDMKVENQRAALAISGQQVFIAFGGRAPGDCGQYHGWMMASALDGTGTLSSHPVPTTRAGGIWAPSGPAIDADGSIFVANGNADGSTKYDHGSSVLHYSAVLEALDFFAPTNWAQLDKQDLDLGSTGPLLLGDDLVFQVGKEGVGYLLDRANLGGIGGQKFAGKICAPPFGGNATVDDMIFVPCTIAVYAVKVSRTPTLKFTAAWKGPHVNSGPPIVSGGYVWSINLTDGHLMGLDPETGTAKFDLVSGPAVTFTSPAAANGRIFIAATNVVNAFGD